MRKGGIYGIIKPMYKLPLGDNHPTHFIRESDRYLVDGFFDALHHIPPNEMFKVINERTDDLVVMKSNDITRLFWAFLHEWRKKHSFWYRLRHGWKLARPDYRLEQQTQ